MKKVLLAYVPVLHAGYLEFFDRHSDADVLFLFGPEQIATFDHLARKDIRAIDPDLMLDVIRRLHLLRSVRFLDAQWIGHIQAQKPEIIACDEDESRQVMEQYFQGFSVMYDPAFLRWDKSRSIKEMQVLSETVTESEMNRKLMGDAFAEAQKSSDWWRQVGAMIVKDDQPIIVAHNAHQPHPLFPYVFGDPRGLFKKGVHIELTTALHAEASVIAEAARHGISLLGTDLYVTAFPCPQCARLIAGAGIRTCYFAGGYGVLDGEDILQRAGVSLVRVVHEPSVR